jgi:DNA (cytosine-5)-methyltransferase 1
MRKRLFIVCFKDIVCNDIEKFFDLSEYEKSVTLSDYLGKKYEKETAYTLRCGGKNSPINDRHNWDGYMVDGKEHRLTIDEGLKLQGFDENFELVGSDKEQWKMLGNTIPTIFTEIIGKQILKHCKF